MGAYALGDRMRNRNDQIVTGNIERFDRAREQGEEHAKMPRRAGETLDEADVGVLAKKPRPLLRRQEVHECEKIGLG